MDNASTTFVVGELDAGSTEKTFGDASMNDSIAESAMEEITSSSSAQQPQHGEEGEEEEEDVEEEERICRYCLGGPDEEDGTLISPCKCAGGQKYVHLSCLRRWQRMVLVSQPTHPAYYEREERQLVSACFTFNNPREALVVRPGTSSSMMHATHEQTLLTMLSIVITSVQLLQLVQVLLIGHCMISLVHLVHYHRSICNVCKSAFQTPPPTRQQLMQSFTGI